MIKILGKTGDYYTGLCPEGYALYEKQDGQYVRVTKHTSTLANLDNYQAQLEGEATPKPKKKKAKAKSLPDSVEAEEQA